jgi:hypothetical protein
MHFIDTVPTGANSIIRQGALAIRLPDDAPFSERTDRVLVTTVLTFLARDGLSEWIKPLIALGLRWTSI